jgi:hypothetical protein
MPMDWMEQRKLKAYLAKTYNIPPCPLVNID